MNKYEIHAKREDVTRLSTTIAAENIDSAIVIFRDLFPGFTIGGIYNHLDDDDIPF